MLVLQIETSKLGGPYGDCVVDDYKNLEKNVFQEKYPTKYSSNVRVPVNKCTFCFMEIIKLRLIACRTLSQLIKVQVSTTFCLLHPQACYNTCYQKHVIARCACADAQFPSQGKAFGRRQVNSCKITNHTQGLFYRKTIVTGQKSHNNLVKQDIIVNIA